MRTIGLYRGPTPDEMKNYSAELIEADSREGQVVSRLYGVVEYPALVVTQDDGRLVAIWQEKLPTRADYLHVANPLN